MITQLTGSAGADPLPMLRPLGIGFELPLQLVEFSQIRSEGCVSPATDTASAVEQETADVVTADVTELLANIGQYRGTAAELIGSSPVSSDRALAGLAARPTPALRTCSSVAIGPDSSDFATKARAETTTLEVQSSVIGRLRVDIERLEAPTLITLVIKIGEEAGSVPPVARNLIEGLAHIGSAVGHSATNAATHVTRSRPERTSTSREARDTSEGLKRSRVPPRRELEDEAERPRP
jgi:hypothetical protein